MFHQFVVVDEINLAFFAAEVGFVVEVRLAVSVQVDELREAPEAYFTIVRLQAAVLLLVLVQRPLVREGFVARVAFVAFGEARVRFHVRLEVRLERKRFGAVAAPVGVLAGVQALVRVQPRQESEQFRAVAALKELLAVLDESWHLRPGHFGEKHRADRLADGSVGGVQILVLLQAVRVFERFRTPIAYVSFTNFPGGFPVAYWFCNEK